MTVVAGDGLRRPPYRRERPPNALLTFQLDCLKAEIDLVDKVITRMETITQNTKYWAVLIWAGTIAVLIGQDNLRSFAYLAAAPIAILWIIDAYWLHLHRGAFVRQRKIAEFLNNGGLRECIDRGSLSAFRLLDPYGEQYKGTTEHAAATSVWRIMLYAELIWLYGGLIAFTLLLQVLLRTDLIAPHL